MITGQITVSLEREPDAEDWGRDRRALAVLEQCPEGATVRIDVGHRKFISQDAAACLHRHDCRLAIVIDGAYPEVISKFIHAARTGEWSVV